MKFFEICAEVLVPKFGYPVCERKDVCNNYKTNRLNANNFILTIGNIIVVLKALVLSTPEK